MPSSPLRSPPLLFSLALLGLASAGSSPPTLAETKGRAVRQYYFPRVGADRARGGLELMGIAAGSTWVFAGARVPTPAVLPLVQWVIIATMSERTCEGVINATTFEEARKARLRQVLPGLVAAVSMAAAQHLTALPGARLSLRMIGSALLGGHLLVECSRGHLRDEIDQIVHTTGAAAGSQLPHALQSLGRGVRILRRTLLPLPALVANRLSLAKTALQSAAGVMEAWFKNTTTPKKAAAVAAVGVGTVTPKVHRPARRVVAKVVDGQFDSRLQGVLPAPLRQANVTAHVRARALALRPFRVLVRAYHEATALLCRSVRWALPLFFAAWGCAVQTGRLALVRDAPSVLVYLLPLQWGHVVPEPTSWVVAQTNKGYSKLLSGRVKRVVARGARRVVAAVRSPDDE